MDIRLFSYSLLVLAIGAYFIPVNNKAKNDDIKDIPLVVFENSIMFTLNENNLTRIVNSSHAIRYKSRDEMYDANIFLKNSLDEKEYKYETLEAQFIMKKGNNLSLQKDVKYNRDNFINLKTDSMYYNLKTNLARNDVPYDGYYYNNLISGTNLYLVGKKNYMKSEDIHFEIEIKSKGK